MKNYKLINCLLFDKREDFMFVNLILCCYRSRTSYKLSLFQSKDSILAKSLWLSFLRYSSLLLDILFFEKRNWLVIGFKFLAVKSLLKGISILYLSLAKLYRSLFVNCSLGSPPKQTRVFNLCLFAS